MSVFTQLRKSGYCNQLSHGPGSPQAPPPQHPLIGVGLGLADLGTVAEKTENFWVNCVPWHEGHSGSALPITSFSKLLWHSWQTYSKIGM